MIDTKLVKKSLALMGGFEEEELEKYQPFVECAVFAAGAMLSGEADENDPRIIQLAAAKAYKAICCTADMADGVLDFKAGDVSLREETDILSNAENICTLAEKDCLGLLKKEEEIEAPAENDSFAFLGV